MTFQIIKRLCNVDSYFEDLRFPVASVSVTADPPSWDDTIGGWLFPESGRKKVFYLIQLPHAWREGTILHPHVHWTKTVASAGDVVWDFDFRWAPIGEVFDSSDTTISAFAVDSTTPDNDLVNEHLITPLPTISGTGKGISDMILAKLSRDGDDTNDTYIEDCRLLEMDIHFERDSWGSDFEFTKKAFGP